MSLFAELKRRNVFRVGGAYAVVAWLLIEISDTIFPRLGLPEWTVTFVIALLLLGFPVALFMAWAFELTPEGVKRTEDLGPDETTRAAVGRPLDYVIMVVLLVALGWFAWDKFGADTAAPAPAEPAPLEASIAVLPFTDMSAAGDQEYFGDGLAEEILNLLAGVPELKVSGRTSSFSFKDKDTPIPEIGRTLGVAHVLEGSVRKSGDRVRITAQLVKAEDGFHLWSETFDRQLADIFAIQDEIAGAIANALQLSLVGQVAGASNLEAYDLYLRARALIYKRTLRDLEEARILIDRALALDPDYAPALAASGELWQLLSADVTSYGDIPVLQARAAATSDLERALQLDPDLADAHAGLGLLSMGIGDYVSADAHLARALAINPSLTNANHWRALNYSGSGRARSAVAAAIQFAERDPLFVINQANLGYYLAVVGDFAAAEARLTGLMQRYPEHIRIPAQLSFARRMEGRLAAAKTSIDSALALDPSSGYTRLMAELAMYNLGDCAGALEHTVGWSASMCRFVLDPDTQVFTQAPLEVGSQNLAAVWGWLSGLSLSGRHEQLLAWFDESGYGVEEFFIAGAFGNELTPLAEAQRATGRTSELEATLQTWGARLEFLAENGNATGYFRYAQASHAALSGQRAEALALLAEAIDMGFRDPFLDRAPAFEPWHDDAEFLAQAARMTELINIERAKLGMEPLS